ncbi:hypothetical protein BC939DRAFT_461268 [Gamsiella multidivaricata]|uniref:uncharacterized protein n=1 Tax=Gamsiella multidivaricata TaxID=101098 RepID=UPI00221F3B5D|nr:uncharacterized protein BC939DRAFT_461268 [Gamsiella multidivaricata]KAI7818993.1 hypothetical protein BC939DRAFT_461268 [Gamsiella multidivaricata]
MISSLVASPKARASSPASLWICIIKISAKAIHSLCASSSCQSRIHIRSVFLVRVNLPTDGGMSVLVLGHCVDVGACSRDTRSAPVTPLCVFRRLYPRRASIQFPPVGTTSSPKSPTWPALWSASIRAQSTWQSQASQSLCSLTARSRTQRNILVAAHGSDEQSL